MRTELHKSMRRTGRRLDWLPAALFRRTRSKGGHNGNGDDSPGGAAAVVYPFRRNGVRSQAVNAVSRARLATFGPRQRPSWSMSRLQTRHTPFRAAAAVALLLMCGAAVTAQSHAPIVTMKVTLPDGRVEELTAPESGLATLKTSDGTEYGFRPTIQDSEPWTRVVVTIFRMPTATATTTTLGEVEVKTGGGTVAPKMSPSFKISVPKIAPPANGGPTTT